MSKEYSAEDSDGKIIAYRLTGSVLEHKERTPYPSSWYSCSRAEWWQVQTPDQLRAIADCLERK